MADLNERDAKLVHYLSEAYGKEKELELSLEAHIAMTTRAPYKNRLKAHLKETKAHGKALERRIKKLGGGGQLAQNVAGKLKAAAKGPIHMVRGSGEQEKMLKNAKTEYWNEHEEIATYIAIESLAMKVGDRETAKVARDIRREEERMAKYLAGQIRTLSGAVATEDIPAQQRRAAAKPRKRAGAKSSRSKTKSSGTKSRSSGKSKRPAKKAGKAKKAPAKAKRARKKAPRTGSKA